MSRSFTLVAAGAAAAESCGSSDANPAPVLPQKHPCAAVPLLQATHARTPSVQTLPVSRTSSQVACFPAASHRQSSGLRHHHSRCTARAHPAQACGRAESMPQHSLCQAHSLRRPLRLCCPKHLCGLLMAGGWRWVAGSRNGPATPMTAHIHNWNQSGITTWTARTGECPPLADSGQPNRSTNVPPSPVEQQGGTQLPNPTHSSNALHGIT